MAFLWSFLISLAISLVFSVVAYLITPAISQSKSATPEAGELDVSTAEEGGEIIYFWGTRILPVNCVWWTPTGNNPIRM